MLNEQKLLNKFKIVFARKKSNCTKVIIIIILRVMKRLCVKTVSTCGSPVVAHKLFAVTVAGRGGGRGGVVASTEGAEAGGRWCVGSPLGDG